jgi:hypothetical protein
LFTCQETDSKMGLFPCLPCYPTPIAGKNVPERAFVPWQDTFRSVATGKFGNPCVVRFFYHKLNGSKKMALIPFIPFNPFQPYANCRKNCYGTGFCSVTCNVLIRTQQHQIDVFCHLDDSPSIRRGYFVPIGILLSRTNLDNVGSTSNVRFS